MYYNYMLIITIVNAQMGETTERLRDTQVQTSTKSRPVQKGALRRKQSFNVLFIHSQVEELFVQFAVKASAFSTTLTNIEEDLVDPVRCNTLDEIQVRKVTLQSIISRQKSSTIIQSLQSANRQLQQAITQAKNDFKQIATLDRQIKSYSASSSNP